MRQKPQALANSINQMVARLARQDALRGFTHAIVTGGAGKYAVSWSGSGEFSPPLDRPFTLDDYAQQVEGQHYTLLFEDFSLVQMTYFLEGDSITGHRLAYVPCPFSIDPAQVEQLGLSVACSAARAEEIVCRGPWRFDYDPSNAREDHAASHLTVNHPECRIPVAYPLCPASFLELVLRQLHGKHLTELGVAELDASRCLDLRGPTWFFDRRDATVVR